MLFEEQVARKPIVGYEGLYDVTEDGRVWSHISGKFLKPSLVGRGYPYVELYKDMWPSGFYVHRLVAEAFIPNPEGLATVDHIDRNKRNNHRSNLRWLSNADNNRREHEGKYCLVSPSGVKHTFSIIRQFAAEQGLHRSGLNDLIRGVRKSSQGWTLHRGK